MFEDNNLAMKEDLELGAKLEEQLRQLNDTNEKAPIRGARFLIFRNLF